MNQFDPEALQTQFGQSGIKPDPISGTVDLNYPLVSKGGDQIELSAGWGQTGIVGRVGLKFTNFSVQNLFKKDISVLASYRKETDKRSLCKYKLMVRTIRTIRFRSSNHGLAESGLINSRSQSTIASRAT